MFWINAENATYKANFDFWDISYLNYDLFVWDILLLIMTFFLILAILWIWQNIHIRDNIAAANKARNTQIRQNAELLASQKK